MCGLVGLLSGGPAVGQTQVFLSEIHYHPVEKAAFDTNGVPLLDLSEDIHEFVELHNTNSVAVPLGGWSLSGGISFDFPPGAVLPPFGFAVVARDPARLVAIPAYNLIPGTVFGPYSGRLGNQGDTVRVKNSAGEVVDSVSYSASFPWAISADALGADDEWTGLNSSNFQYRGRSLERVSFRHPANDPANWLASPLLPGPSPLRTNAVQRDGPRPIVTQFSAAQAGNGATIIRSNEPIRVEAVFSAAAPLTGVAVEYFLDDVNQTNETRTTVAMTPVGVAGEARFAATLPGQPARTLVRFRFRADRGGGMETVSPRADDPFPWHACFVTPVRTSANPVYDVFIATASLTRLATNLNGQPRRVTLPDPPGLPRDSWNATEPAVFVHNGVVHDIRMRHHGSRYNRNPSRKSYKFQFPDYAPFNGRTSYFETDKGEEHRLGSMIYDAADLPMWRTRYVDIHLNSDPMDPALEQEELDQATYERWIEEQAARHPGSPRERLGETYKASGVVPFETGLGQGTATSYEASGEGPYYIGNGAPIPRKAGWSLNERYDWTYGLQVDPWRGGSALRALIEGLWEARGDSPLNPNPNLPALRAFLAAHFDVEATLTYIALRNWSAPFDNATHNHFLWQQGDGRWGMLPWDLDVEFGLNRATQSIYWDEFASPQPDTLRGPHWVKDSFLKAYRDEYRQRLFILNNTLLSPAQLTAIGAAGLSSYAALRQTNVNAQLALGPWFAPLRPTNAAPAAPAGNPTPTVFPPAALVSSPYLHSAPVNAPAHARTTWLLRAAGGSYAAPILRLTTTNASHLTSLPIPFDRLTFGVTYFWKCVHVDADGHPSAESVETPFVFGAPPVPGNVVLNEILADNPGSVLNESFAPDYIELFNTTAAPQDLSQLSVSDDPANPGRFRFPPGTVLPPAGHLVLWCDRATNAPGLHTGFALDNDGQTVLLFTVTNGGFILADALTFGLQIPGQSVGRSPVSGWTLNEPTPGAANQPAPLGPVAGLRINEWMASSTTDPDWLELHNPDALPVALGGLLLADSPAERTNSRVAALSFIAPRGHRRFFADENPGQGPRHLNFRLGASGDSILLSAPDLSPIDTVTFGPQTTDVSAGRLPDGAATVVSFPGSASPEAPNHRALAGIVINEILPNIELHNPGPQAIDVGGWWLGNNRPAPEQYQIPAGTILAPGGFWAVAANALPFQLDPVRGGRVILSRDGLERTEARYGPFDGHSQGTIPTSLGPQFDRLTEPTFGAPNAPPIVGPVFVSEIQYHPPDLPGDDDDYEFIELANRSAAPVNLFHPSNPTLAWRLRDAVSFTFPPSTTIAPGEHLLVVGFDPATNAPALAAFRAAHDIPAGTRLFGPFNGRLDNAGASVELAAPLPPISTAGPDYGEMPEVRLDRIRYGDQLPWPTAADGAGPSLQRVAPSAYGNDPVNWFASGVTPGAPSASNVSPSITITAPAPGAALPVNQPILLTATAQDSDGALRRIEFLADGQTIGVVTNGPFAWTWSNAPAGPHVLGARAIDNRLGITFATPVSITVSNRAPTVALTAPAPGTFVTLPADIALEATASDADGTVTRVEFLANGTRLGEVTSPPWRWLWTNPRSGAYTLAARAFDDSGAATLSPGVPIVAAREVTIAYVVETNTVGSQALPNPYAIGMDFTVLSPVILTHLGCFDSGSDGLNASSTLTTQIFNRNGATPVVIAGTNFTAADPGTPIGGSRFKPLATPLVLTNGSYSVVGYGYDGNNRNGNLGTGNAKTWTTDDGGGLLSFTGGGRYGAFAPGGFPTTLDGGPADRYAAATFQFRRLTATPTIVGDPIPVFVRAGGTTNLTVAAIGNAPLRYQWSFNGTAIPGATNATLLLTNVQAANEGAYRASVANELGSALSAPATVTLLVNPGFVLRPLDQAVVSNGSFTVSVAITGAPPPFRFEWREQSTVRSITNSEARTNFFTFGPVTNLAARQWRLIVTNAASLAPGINAVFNVVALPDADADGLPDAWEVQAGLNPASAADRDLDADGDGLSNEQEYQAGTDPRAAGSFLRIETFNANPGATLTFGAQSNRTYSVQFTDTPGAPWQRLADVIAHPTNRVATVIDPASTPRRFYRLTTPRWSGP